MINRLINQLAELALIWTRTVSFDRNFFWGVAKLTNLTIFFAYLPESAFIWSWKASFDKMLSDGVLIWLSFDKKNYTTINLSLNRHPSACKCYNFSLKNISLSPTPLKRPAFNKMNVFSFSNSLERQNLTKKNDVFIQQLRLKASFEKNECFFLSNSSERQSFQ